MTRSRNESGLGSSPLKNEAAASILVIAVLSMALIIGPLLLGATGPWARLAMECVMALTAVAWALSSRPRPLAALWPVAAAAVVALQLVPLPDGMLAPLAPVSATAWKIARAGLAPTWACITVDPAATAAGIRRLLLASATLAVVTAIGKTSAHLRSLSAALAASCAMIWALGLAFPFDKSLVLLGFIDCKGPIAAEFWKTPIVPPIATNGSGNLDWVSIAGQRYANATWIAADGFGPYIYSNHFAGAMCLTLPILVAVWLQFSRDWLPDLARRGVAVIIGAGALWTVGIVATSRAGAAALLLAMLVFTTLTSERSWLRRAALVATVVYAVLLLMFTFAMYGLFPGVEKAFPLAIQPRIAALLADGRAVASRVALRMFAASPFMGSGLSTFGQLFTRFLRGDALLNYAHNDCAQWLAETGVVGGGLLAAFLATLVAQFRAWMRSAPTADRTLEAGAWASLAGIGFHSLFDWNLHIPANALLACVVAGLAISSSAPAVSAARSKIAGRSSLASWIATRGPSLVLTAACGVALVFLARDAFSETVQRKLREAIVASRLAAMDSKQPSSDTALKAAIASGERMVDRDPWNADLVILIGQAHLHLSTEEQPIDDANDHLAAAEEWFTKARRQCAACRGLPEPLPVARPRRSP